MSDSEDLDALHERSGKKDHPPHGNRLTNGEMCARCGEVHWHCGTLEEVAIETSLSCIRHLAPMRAFHMEVADLYLQLLKDGWMDEDEDGPDWCELGTDLVIKWIATLVQDGTMDRFSNKAVVKVFGKECSEHLKLAAKRAARVHLAAVTVVSDYLSELLPSLGRKKLNLKGMSLLKRRVAVAQAVHKHCQNVVWDGSRGTLIGTVAPLCRKVLSFDMDEVDRMMVKIKAELKQTRLLEDASGIGHPPESASHLEARANGPKESVVDEKAEQASKAIADALLATEEANKRLTDAMASGDPDKMQAAISSGDRADPAVRKAATKAMRKARADRQQVEAVRQKELERQRKEAEEEAERAEAAARALVKSAKSKPTPVRSKFATLEEKDETAESRKKKVVKSKPAVSTGPKAGVPGTGAAWKEARKSGLESVRSSHTPTVREPTGNEDLTWDAMALKYNGFNSQNAAAPSSEQLLKQWQTPGFEGRTSSSGLGGWEENWQKSAPYAEAQLATPVSFEWGEAENSWGSEPFSASPGKTDSWQAGGSPAAVPGMSYKQTLPVGNGVYKEFLTEAEQDFWKPVVLPNAGTSTIPAPASLSQSVADLRLNSEGSWRELASSYRPANVLRDGAEKVPTKLESRGVANGEAPRDDEEDCVICWDGPRNALYLPCGHARFCYPCAMQTFEAGQPCPVCRSGISWVQQMFD